MSNNLDGGLAWRKSSYSGNSGNCVEVADLPDGGMALRDSKNPSRAPFLFTAAEWDAFLKGAKAREFDR
jgi:hypothetical protein